MFRTIPTDSPDHLFGIASTGTDVLAVGTLGTVSRLRGMGMNMRFQRSAIRISSHRKLDNVMSAQALDQIWRRTFRNDLTMVHDREPVA